MASIKKRGGLGRPLTNNELDANFDNINAELATKASASHTHSSFNALSLNSLSVANRVTLSHEVYNVSGTAILDFYDANNWVINMTGNVTLMFVDPQPGQSGVIFLKQDATGGRTLTLPSEAKTPRGAAIAQVTAPNSISVLSYSVLDASNVLVNYIGDFR